MNFLILKGEKGGRVVGWEDGKGERKVGWEDERFLVLLNA